MDDVAFLRVKPLSMKTTRSKDADSVLLRVMGHNLRQLPDDCTSRFDPRLSPRNVVIIGPTTATDAAELANSLMRDAGIVARANAMLAIEAVISVPTGWKIDSVAYFHDSVQWAKKYFKCPMLSAIAHHDESNPHLHIVMVPIRGTRLQGTVILGGRSEIAAMHLDFFESVGRGYGLQMPTAKKRLSESQRCQALDDAFDMLKRNSDLDDKVLKVLIAPHLAEPGPLLKALGLPMPKPEMRKGKTFVSMMIRPIRPEREGKNTYRGFKHQRAAQISV